MLQRNVKFFLCCLLLFSLVKVEAKAVAIHLFGNLGEEEIVEAKKQLNAVEEQSSPLILIEINSSSGDLRQVLGLARSIYELKAAKGATVVVYIQESALGPAAIIPFLADQLFASYFVSWGDIALGSEDAVPINVLRSTVSSLISPTSKNAQLLLLMASGMTDPSLQLVDDKGWKIGDGTFGTVVSKQGEVLVVNHNQLNQLGLVEGFLSLQQFRERFLPKEEAKEEIIEDQAAADGRLSSKVLRELKQRIVFKPEGSDTVGLIRIDDKKSQISQATWIYVKAALDHYKEKKPAFIILELNTPGGEVFSAQKISDALKDIDTQYDIPVVCFINNWAISAGAMLAYSCRFIAVTKDASMGAAEPVVAGESGQMVAASEKVNSALRADFANRARFFDRNPDIAEAMVDKDMILVERFGKVVRLNNEDQIRTKGPNPDRVISPKGKLLTLNAAEMLRLGVADIPLEPAKTALITEKEREAGRWPADKTLLFQSEFFKALPQAEVDYYQMDWKEQFLVFISNPVITSLLFLGMLLGFYIEINTPGFGFPGSVALICLFLIILSSVALEVAHILEFILLLVGVIFICLDLFLIPTFGILGIIGTVFFLMGLFGMMLPGIGEVGFEVDTQTFNAAGEVFIRRLAWLCGTLVLAVVLMAALGRFISPSFAAFRRLVLIGGEEDREAGYIAGADPKKLPQVGQTGKVMATLRPAGNVMIGDEIYDAITYGTFIEKGEEIVVEQLEGSVIVVAKKNEHG